MRYLFRFSHSLFVFAGLAFAAPVWAQSASDKSGSQACGTSSIDYVDEAGLTPEERIRRMDAALMRSLNRYDECQDDDAREREKEQQDPDPTQQNADGGGTTSTGAEGADPSEGSEGEGAAPQGSEGEAAAEGSESEGESEGTAGAAASAAAGDISGSDPGPGPGQSSSMPLPGVIPSLPSAQSGAEGQGGSGGASGRQNGSSQPSGVGGGTVVENLPAGSSSAASGDMAGTEPVAPPRAGGGGDPEDEGGQAGRAGSRENTGVAGTGPRALPNGKLPEDIPPADNDSVLEAQIRQAAINETDPELKKKLWNEYRRYKGLPQVK